MKNRIKKSKSTHCINIYQRLRNNFPSALYQSAVLILLIITNPFGLNSMTNSHSKESWIKLLAPFYPHTPIKLGNSDTQANYKKSSSEDIVVLLFDDIQLYNEKNNTGWPPSYYEYLVILDIILKQKPKGVFIDLLFTEEHKEKQIHINTLDKIDKVLINRTNNFTTQDSIAIEELRSHLKKAASYNDIECFSYALETLPGASKPRHFQAKKSLECSEYQGFNFSSTKTPVIFASPLSFLVNSANQQVILKPNLHSEDAVAYLVDPKSCIPTMENKLPYYKPDNYKSDEQTIASSNTTKSINYHKLTKAFVHWIKDTDDYRLAYQPCKQYEDSQYTTPYFPCVNNEYLTKGTRLSPALAMFMVELCNVRKTIQNQNEFEKSLVEFTLPRSTLSSQELSVYWGINSHIDKHSIYSSENKKQLSCFQMNPINQAKTIVDSWIGFARILSFISRSSPEGSLNWKHPINSNCTYHNTIYAHDLIRDYQSRISLADKYVFIGASAENARDHFQTPLYGRLPGVNIHAMAFDNLLNYNNQYIHVPGSIKPLPLNILNIMEILILFCTTLLFEKGSSQELNQQYSLAKLIQIHARNSVLLFTVSIASILLLFFQLRLTPLNWTAISLIGLTLSSPSIKARILELIKDKIYTLNRINGKPKNIKLSTVFSLAAISFLFIVYSLPFLISTSILLLVLITFIAIPIRR